MNISDTIIQYFINKDTSDTLNKETILSFNYMENHFFSSIEFIEMISDFEDSFSINFSDEQLKNKNFSTVGGLINMIEKLAEEKLAC